MALVEREDYVFFPKAHVIESRLTGKVSDACFLGTRRYIFVVPKRSIQSFLVATRIKTYHGGDDPATGLQQLLSLPSLTAEQLEHELLERLRDDTETRIFSLDELETFKMTGGFLGQTKLKLPRDKLKLITIRGKGNKACALEFYRDRLQDKS